MKSMNSKVLKNLEHIQKDINITIYLPVLVGPQNTAANISTLHHAVSSLKKVLNDAEIPKTKHQQIINNITKLDQELGHSMSGKSLAIFIDKNNNVIAYQVPFYIEGTIYVMAHSLQLGPLKAQYNDHLHYWVLNLSQNGCKLYRGDKLDISEVQDTELAKDLITTLRLEQSDQKMPQSHSVNSPGFKPSESFNGHGGYKDISKKYLEDYLRLVDKKITRHIARPSEPIILIGVDYVQSMYKKVSNHKNILASRSALSHNSPTVTNLKSIISPILPHLSTI